MKKLLSILFVVLLVSSLATTPSTAGASPAAQSELGQLKVCKAGGSGVTQGQLFTIRVGSTDYSVPAGFCVLAGQFALNTQVTIQEVIPSGYYVAAISTRPSSSLLSQDTAAGRAVVQIGSGVTEVIYTNLPNGVPTSTPRPTNTPGTGTPQPTGRLQICKEAGDPGVTGYFNFRFESRTFRVPVGACSVLVHVGVGTLTVTEDAQSGYRVEDIYTIPADRLISKNLNNRSATIQIVEGTAASQTVVVFRNRSTSTATGTATSTATSTPTGSPTSTATATPTGTLATATSTPTGSATPTATSTGSVTPPACVETTVTANFNLVPVGASVEGMNTVAPGLNIDANGTAGTAIHIHEGVDPQIYSSPLNRIQNPGLGPQGGFTDLEAHLARAPHRYTFTFASGTFIKDFSLHMLDHGDFNPTGSTSHFATMTAYGVGDIPISQGQLSYTGGALAEGDALVAAPGQPGNWTWHVSGSGIVKIVLEFHKGHDPNIAFDTLTFTTACLACTPTTQRANFNLVPVGASVEGMGTVLTGLNIDANGTAETATHIHEGVDPQIYSSPLNRIQNPGLGPAGGFTDLEAHLARAPHQYTFSFAPGLPVSNFSLHMLDFGDFNPTGSTSHLVTMTAYDAGNNVISQQQLSYAANVLAEGDILVAAPGQPGNWTWFVSGPGIVKVLLEFPQGYDPNIGFDDLAVSLCQ